MEKSAIVAGSRVLPAPSAIIELLKPITWFAPMWAFGCGIVSSGEPVLENWHLFLVGIVLSGPLVCGTSQAANDWYDRHVDLINEPGRPIPSGRIPGRWGLYVAIAWTVLSLLVAALLGAWVLGAAIVGLIAAWIYSAPPLRLKLNGWWGNSAVGLCYEGLPWFTGAAALTGALPNQHIIILALLYSIGAHGIMTLNDFKSVEGDSQLGIRSLPVQHGISGAARIACAMMTVPQIIVIGLLINWQRPWHALAVGLLLAVQLVLMRKLLGDPKRFAAWYNATGTTLYVLGMLASAFAVRFIGLASP
jgi:chlorophyll/bacteriochlorophyll a synthase